MGLTAFNRARRRHAAQESEKATQAKPEAKPEPQVDRHAELLAKAKEMGLSVRKNMKEDTLEELIREAETASD